MKGLKVTNAANRSGDILLLLEINEEILFNHDLEEIEKEIIKRANEHDELVNVLKRQSDLVLELQALNRDFVALLKEVLEYGDEGLCIDEHFADRIESALEKAEGVE